MYPTTMFDSEYKRKAIKIAKDLRYGKQVIEKIQQAKNDADVEHIMISARREKFKND